MKIHFRLFALQAEKCGTSAITFELPDSATVFNAVEQFKTAHTKLPWPPGTMVAVNQQYAAMTDRLHPEDEVAFIPPVSGG